MTDQYLRYCKLYVVGKTDAIDLSEFRIVFSVHQSDFESPNHAEIKVYNLSRDTMRNIVGEYSKVHLEAGYENGARGTIFNGTISQFHVGRENNTDTFFEILAMDGDVLYNDTFINKTLDSNITMKQRADAIKEEVSKAVGEAHPSIDPKTSNALYWSTPSLRGVVLFGLARGALRNLASSCDTSWSVQNGGIQFVDTQGYLEGEVVELNSVTGMIGSPKQTDQGIEVACLLNQKIRIGGLIELNNGDITQTILNSMFPHNQWAGLVYAAPLSPTSRYRVLVVEHKGDTRGTEWTTSIIGMAVDASSQTLLGGI